MQDDPCNVHNAARLFLNDGHGNSASERIAIYEPNRPPLTYHELDAQVSQLGQHLLKTGVNPGQRVAILLPDSRECVIGFLATLKVAPWPSH